MDIFFSGLGLGVMNLDDPDALRRALTPYITERTDDWKTVTLGFPGTTATAGVHLLNTGQAHLLVRFEAVPGYWALWDLLFDLSKHLPLGVAALTHQCVLVAAGFEWEMTDTPASHPVLCADAIEMYDRFTELEGTESGETPHWAIPEAQIFDHEADAADDHLLPSPVNPETVEQIMHSVAEVDWKAITHCYGPASDVPELLRLWLSNDQRNWQRCTTFDLFDSSGETITDRAGAMLFNATFHQMTLYDASAPMATAMIETVRTHTDSSIRLEALSVLGLCLSNGAPGYEADGFQQSAHRKPEVWQAAAAGWETYLGLLDVAQDAEIRAMAARMLPWLLQNSLCSQTIIKHLDGVEEPDPLVEALLLLALGTLAPRRDAEAVRLSRARTNRSHMVGFAATIALARLGALDRQSDAEQVQRIEQTRDSSIGALGEFTYSADEGSTDLIARDALLRIDANHSHATDGDLFARCAPEFAEHHVHCSPVDDKSFALLPFGSGQIHIVSLLSLATERTIRVPTASNLDSVLQQRIPSQNDELNFGTVDLANLRLLRVRASPDGRFIAADGTGTVAVWDLLTDSELPQVLLTGFIPTRVNFAWSPDSRTLATANDGHLHFWSVNDSKLTSQQATKARELNWAPYKNPVISSPNQVHELDPEDGLVRLIYQTPSNFLALAANGDVAILTPHGVEVFGPSGPVVHDRLGPASHATFGPKGQLAVITGDSETPVLWVLKGPQGVSVPLPDANPYQLGGLSCWSSLLMIDGPTLRFHEISSAKPLASCHLIDPETGDLLWIAKDDTSGDDWVATSRPESINVCRTRGKLPPVVATEAVDQRATYLAAHENPAAIRSRLLRQIS